MFAKRAKSTGGRVSTFFQAQAGGTGKTLAELAISTGEEGLLELAAQLPQRHGEEKERRRKQLEAKFGTWYLQWRCARRQGRARGCWLAAGYWPGP